MASSGTPAALRIQGFIIYDAARTSREYYYVYVMEEHRVYTFPSGRLKECKNDPLYKDLSGNKKRDVDGGHFEIGDYVRCLVKDSQRALLSTMIPMGYSEKRYQFQSNANEYLFFTQIVFSEHEGEARQCYASGFDNVDFDPNSFILAMPNVGLNGLIDIRVDEASRTNYRLTDIVDVGTVDVTRTFGNGPRYYIGPVADDQTVVDSALWNRGRHFPEVFDPTGEAYDDFAPDVDARAREQHRLDTRPPEGTIEGKGLVVEMGVIICKTIWQWELRVPWIAPQHRHDKWAGHIVKFVAFFNKYNGLLIVQHLKDAVEPIEVRESFAMQGAKTFPAEVARTDVGAVYSSPHVGFVVDPNLVLDRIDMSDGQTVCVFLRYVGGRGMYRFYIDSIGDPEHNRIVPCPSPERDVYEGEALFIGSRSILFVKSYRHARFIVSPDIIGDVRLEPGTFINVRAARDVDNGRIFKVTKIFGNASRARLETRLFGETTYLMATKIEPSKVHPLFVTSDVFGPLKCAHFSEGALHAALVVCNTSIKGWVSAMRPSEEDNLTLKLESVDVAQLTAAALALR